ncbi:MAG: hypothetical protein WCG27_06415 [Pseudomonadota bacterium]
MIKKKAGIVELESLLWASILLSLAVGGWQIHRHYQKKAMEIIKEFHCDWRNIAQQQ